MRTLEGYIIPAAVTVLLHAALVLVLAMNWQSAREPLVKPAPRHVKAHLVTLEKSGPKASPKPAAPQPPPKPRQEPPKPKAEPPKPAPRLKPEPPKPQPKPQAKPQPKPQPKPPSKPPEVQKPDPRVQEQARQRDQQQREQQQVRERQQRERELALALAEEEQALAEGSETTTYEEAIAMAIEDNWSRPPSARRNMQVVLRIQLIPTGDVVGVSVLKSSGDDAFDRSAVNAVNKAARFPEVANAPPQVFERHLRSLQLVFRPEDLRQ